MIEQRMNQTLQARANLIHDECRAAAKKAILETLRQQMPELLTSGHWRDDANNIVCLFPALVGASLAGGVEGSPVTYERRALAERTARDLLAGRLAITAADRLMKLAASE